MTEGARSDRKEDEEEDQANSYNTDTEPYRKTLSDGDIDITVNSS